jgi:hypothetical protein
MPAKRKRESDAEKLERLRRELAEALTDTRIADRAAAEAYDRYKSANAYALNTRGRKRRAQRALDAHVTRLDRAAAKARAR